MSFDPKPIEEIKAATAALIAPRDPNASRPSVDDFFAEMGMERRSSAVEDAFQQADTHASRTTRGNEEWVMIRAADYAALSEAITGTKTSA